MTKIDSLTGDSLSYYYYTAKFDTTIEVHTETGELIHHVCANCEIKEGEYKHFFKNKKLSEVGKYSRNNKNGEWFYYSYDGKLMRNENYIKGNLTGKYVEYFSDGKISVIGNYKVVMVEDLKYIVWGDKMPSFDDNCVYGARESICIGTWTWYNYNGTKKKEIIYKYF